MLSHQYGAHLLLLERQDDLAVRNRLEHHALDLESGLLDALALVLADGGRSGHEEHTAFKSVSEHVDRILDTCP